jgi:hypothetical protein
MFVKSTPEVMDNVFLKSNFKSRERNKSGKVNFDHRETFLQSKFRFMLKRLEVEKT